jgi:hypothetical protein
MARYFQAILTHNAAIGINTAAIGGGATSGEPDRIVSG